MRFAELENLSKLFELNFTLHILLYNYHKFLKLWQITLRKVWPLVYTDSNYLLIWQSLLMLQLSCCML